MSDVAKVPAVQRRGPIDTLGAASSWVAARFVPDPFVLAIILTCVTLVLGVTIGQTVEGMAVGERLRTVVAGGWYLGLFGSGGLTFAFQMVLVLVTGHAFALSPPVQKGIDVLARLPRTGGQAAALVAFAACLSGYIHWGLGAVAGAMLAREIGRSWAERGKALHYPLLGAAAYSGLLVWHGGLSGSAPLKVAEKGHFLEEVTGVISVDQTLFSTLNITTTGLLVLACVVVYALLSPKRDEDIRPFVSLGADELSGSGDADAVGGRQNAAIAFVENSLAIPVVVFVLAVGTLGFSFWSDGFGALNLNSVNLAFFALGLMLHGSPRSYVKAAADGAKGSVGIILQFPLYFGILGMLKASGLIVQLSDFFVDISTATTLPLFTFFSAGLVNLFVPSGGGQWAVQGPVITKAAIDLGLEPSKVVMALAYGDAWTNMLQPFWALPLLGITGLRARDIIGYTTLVFLIAAPVVLGCLLVL